MAMLIPVTNQKTKSIRSACFDAGVGSQGTKKATADVTAAAANPTAIKRTSTPLRTIASLLNPQEKRLFRTSVTNPLRWEFPRCGYGYTRAHDFNRTSTEGSSNGNRSRSVTDRRRGHPRLGSQRQRRRRQRGRDRLDPDDRRSGRSRSVGDLLVDLGGPRLLGAPPRRLRRRSPAPRAGLLKDGELSASSCGRDGFGRPVSLL